MTGGSPFRPHSLLKPTTPFAPQAFRVVAGESRYLGELHMGFVVKQRTYSLPMLDTGRPTLRDSHVRDLPLLAVRWPGVDLARVKIAPLAAGAGVAPGVVTVSAPGPAPALAPVSASPPLRSNGDNPPGFTSRPYKPPAPITTP